MHILIHMLSSVLLVFAWLVLPFFSGYVCYWSRTGLSVSFWNGFSACEGSRQCWDEHGLVHWECKSLCWTGSEYCMLPPS